MIAAMTPARVIGAQNTMPWHLPADLQHFKRVTLGKPVIMGRNTYESIGKALPGRPNIVVSSRDDYVLPDASVVNHCEKALELAQSYAGEEVMIIGGGRIYQSFLPQAQRLYLTLIDADIKGDTYFPNYEDAAYWREIAREHREADERNPHDLTFVTLERISASATE
ncbi:type 3 dihydrofolate reductase [Alteromonas oceanisediminis]|uniref:type 3 dihydrofolate reductase n=1 Tax=Alteromonas oceanisediminis TaxID=2836180 RepID=UPI001BD972B2|nr:type 3 dihydrofolate reductase [Alteromonas oceanisediminis]MBT0585394.1 type 3 dihydrofolate reductase [Alteromonas oceanisediminis]